MWNYILILAGFVLVIKGASLLVDGACCLARKLSVSDLVIGLTVVAFGTSLPELAVNVFASISASAGIATGNILGSNIANILLILGVSSLIYPLTVTKSTVWKEIPLSLLAVVVLGIMANDRFIDGSENSVLSRTEGLVLLGFFVIFIYYSVGIARHVEGSEKLLPARVPSITKVLVFILLGLAALVIGGRFVVDGAVALAQTFGVSQRVIGLTIVAVGTSLPELATSAVAAYRKNPEIAVGNIVGSNIFNIFFILGVSSIIRPLTIEKQNNIDLAVLVLAGILLFVFMFTGKKHRLDRWEAILFLVIYAVYIYCIIAG